MFLTYDGDDIGSAVMRATASDDIEQVRAVDAKIRAGAAAWENWARENGAEVIEVGGDEGRFAIPEEAIEKIPEAREAYAKVTGFTCSVGIGSRISESDKALAIAKIDGKNRAVQYSPTVGDRFERLMYEQRSETQKLQAAYSEPNSSAPTSAPVAEGREDQEAQGTPSEEDEDGRDDNFVSRTSFDDVKARLDDLANKSSAPSDGLSGLRHIYDGIVSKIGDIQELQQNNPKAYALAVKALLGIRQMIRDSKGD